MKVALIFAIVALFFSLFLGITSLHLNKRLGQMESERDYWKWSSDTWWQMNNECLDDLRREIRND